MFNIQLAVYTPLISPTTALRSSSWRKGLRFPTSTLQCQSNCRGTLCPALEYILGALQDKGLQGLWWDRPRELPRVYQARMVHTGLHLQEAFVTLSLRGFSKTICHFTLHFHSVYYMLSSSPVMKEKGNVYLRGREFKSINKNVLGTNWQVEFISLWNGLELIREGRAHFNEGNNAAEAPGPDSA